MAEMLNAGVAAFSGAFTVWFCMLLAKLWHRAHGDKSMWDELWDRMQYLTGHMK